MGGRGPGIWDITLCFPRPLASNWIRNRATRTLISIHIGCQHWGQGLYLLCYNIGAPELFLWKYLFVHFHLSVRQSDRWEREKREIWDHPFVSQMPSTAGAAQGWTEAYGSFIWISMWVAGIRHMAIITCCVLDVLGQNWAGRRGGGRKLTPGILIGDGVCPKWQLNPLHHSNHPWPKLKRKSLFVSRKIYWNNWIKVKMLIIIKTFTEC